MAIDPRIAMGFQMPEMPSQLGMAANALQLKNALRQGQMADMEMQQRQAEMERSGQLRNFLAQTDINTPEGMAAFSRQFPLEAPKIQAQMLEPKLKQATLDKDTAQAGKYKTDAAAAEFRLKQDKIAQNLQMLGGVQNPQQAEAWIAGGVKSGLLDMQSGSAAVEELRKAAAAGPQGFEQWKAAQQSAGMTIVQQMEQQWKAKDFQLGKEKFEETKRSNKAQESISYGNLGVARGNLDLRRKEFDAGGAVKPPAGYRWKYDGTQEPIPGGPADPNTKQNSGNITEGERNAGGYASRMIEATKLLDQFENAGRETYATRIVGALPGVGSAARGETMTPEQQQYRQAAEDWVRAKLRKESGAVIGKEEMEAEIQTYFPMPWDKPETIAQKRRAREVANEAMRTAAGRGFKTKTDGGPAVGTVQDGYRFKGGNPADPKSWEKL